MKRLIVASLALVGMTASSLAADIRPSRMEMAPVRAPAILPFNWGGWYAGLNLGGGFNAVSGIVFGGQVGYNMQMDRWVFGVETDLQVTGQDGTKSVVASSGATVALTQDLDWFGTFRGRIGYTVMDRWLPYFTLGLAYGGRSATSVTGFTGSDTNVGWAIGVGVDYAINQWWSARLEYLHVSLDSFSVRNAAGATASVGNLENDIIRGAVNYRFMH